jgi:O-methyltransferase involved in polyketide biosynthesis
MEWPRNPARCIHSTLAGSVKRPHTIKNMIVTKEKIKLTDEKETLFIPLYGKALDYRSKNPIIKDSTANDIVEKLDIDITKYKSPGNKIFAVRAKQYDKWAEDFIAKNQNAVVVHLGCGLDARITRVNPPISVTWFDIDYPEVITWRKKFYSETKEYKMIEASITTQSWLETIPSYRPVFIMAEGVFEYIAEEDIKMLFQRLTNHFSHGQIAFDIMNSSARDAGNKSLKNTMGAVAILKWAVDDINEVDNLNSKLKRAEVLPLIKSRFTKDLSYGLRFLLVLLSLFPKKKNGMRLIRYDF